MKPIVWSNALSMGDPEVDRQHRRFIDEVNALIAAAEREAGRFELSKLARAMAADARAHFAYEDGLLRRLDFPGAEEHSAEHRRIESVLDAIMARLAATANTDRGTVLDIALQIRDLLLDHLLYYDLKYKSAVEHRRQFGPLPR